MHAFFGIFIVDPTGNGVIIIHALFPLYYGAFAAMISVKKNNINRQTSMCEAYMHTIMTLIEMHDPVKVQLFCWPMTPLIIIGIDAYRLRASEERQCCALQNIAIPITRISNPMQALNFSTLMYPRGHGDSSYFSNGASPSLFPSSSLILTPPSSSDRDRGRKGISRSKRTVPKPPSALAPDDLPEMTLNFGLHTPPESPEDLLDIRCYRGNNVETPRGSLSELENDAEEEEEMQDYRYALQ